LNLIRLGDPSAQRGVTEANLSADLRRTPAPLTNYSGGRLASCGLAGHKRFFHRQDAQLGLPVGTERTMEQSPAALESNDADDTRLDRNEVSAVRQPGATNARRIRHNAP
jgi:hypothetical protein